MRESGGFLLVVFGLLLLWIVVTGKATLLENFILQLFDLKTDNTSNQSSSSNNQSGLPSLPELPHPGGGSW